MDKTYDPKDIEQSWYQRWEEGGYFRPSETGTPYCIMIPPPNVTGSLHMGHAFQDTIMDALIRYHRMCGHDTLWQAGTDHAGIATQMVVERQLDQQGTKRQDLGREEFVKRVWAWKEASGGTITRQLRRMAASVDWETERFTMDAGLSNAVLETFVRLYEEGLIYRGKRLVNWDPVFQTAVSDLEVVSEEEEGKLWHIEYPLVDGTGSLVVATTRPETMLGDTAVAVHPHDERYQGYVGKQVALPLTAREIPIIADEMVDPEFGSGAVKITPAHDFNDYATGLRHNLEQINIFTTQAKLNDGVPAPYRGLDRYAARDKVVEDLDASGRLVKVQAHRMVVPRGDRSQSVIEPYLTDQWFVNAGVLAGPAIEAVEQGRIKFVPENWSKTYFEWMRNIEDWCISRQLWWGHRIPAWYDEDGNIYVGLSEAAVRAKHGLGDTPLTRDPDVLDTWFSSALWPFSTIGWPDSTPRLQRYYPTSVLVTGFDIIFFWVARMIMMGVKFMGDVPFHEVYIHGLVRDAHGNKMSKSKGNILDPLDLIDGTDLEALVRKRTTGLMRPDLAPQIEKDTRAQYPGGIPAFGTDALRFTFCSLATTGRDIRFDLGRIEGYRNFCNKLWNAARFVLMNTEEGDRVESKVPAPRKNLEENPGTTDQVLLSVADRWIISLLQRTEAAVHEHFQHYRFDLAAQSVYEFTWDEFCSWYLELCKPVLNDPQASPSALRGTRQTLAGVLEALLRLLHPMMPFITEEIWQQIAPRAGCGGDTIMRAPFPEPELHRVDEESLAAIVWVKRFVVAVRQIRGEQNIPPNRRIPVLVQDPSPEDRARIEGQMSYLKNLADIESIKVLEGGEPPFAAATLAGDMTILVPLADLIDKTVEISRKERDLSRTEKDLSRVETKLANSKFVDRAPPEVVEKERARLNELKLQLTQLRGQLEQLRRL